jgi:hypothetical protein
MMHELKDIPADSDLGMKILSKARNLEDYSEFVNTWVSGYSIKFQGCHHISQWNDEAEDEEAVRIITKRLVRFRLCPTQYCSSGNTQGCANGYGDYIIDMNTYLQSYMELKAQNNENQQKNYEDQYQQYQDGQYQDAQQYQYQAAQYDWVENEDVSQYVECSQADFGRRLQDEGNYNNYGGYNQYNQWDGQYYIGPYCASQGGAIYLGVFTDESCSTFADNNGGRDTYAANTGSSLPFSNTNMVNLDCLACSENGAYYYNNGDEADQDDVLEACETIYTISGKCEQNLPYGTTYTTNNNACTYMEGIKIVRKDGTIQTAAAKANKTASVFIGLLLSAFILLSGYVYFLKTKLERTTINLSED